MDTTKEPMDTKIRWGILGAGTIARRFATSLAHEERSELCAISGRNADHLAAFAAEHPVDSTRIYLSHDELIADPSIDAIYLALPHGLHAAWAERALRAGKAVLCEKPAALSASEVHQIVAAARETNTLFMEAMKPRFVPLHARLQTLLATGELGHIERVETHQLVHMDRDRGGYIADPVQGGVLFDMGIYEASWLEELLPGEVELKSLEQHTNGAVDWYDKAELEIGGRPALLEVSAETGYTSVCHIVCERGSIDIDLLHRPTHATVHPLHGLATEIDAPYVVDDFFGEISHFVDCFLAGKSESPLLSLAAIEREAHILDVIRAGVER